MSAELSDELISGTRALADQLPGLVSKSSACACELSPCNFFIAWNGVLALVYSGFPPSLAALKATLSGSADCALTPENFGSKWPKTTLGALADNAPSLTLSEFEALKALCERHSEHLSSVPFVAQQLSVVTYRARGLEAEFGPSKVAVPLPSASHAGVDRAPPVEEQTAVVRSVLAEWDTPAAYLARVNQPGSRIGSYRQASPAGSTLVSFLANGGEHDSARGDHALLALIRAFRDDVDTLLPGRYVWLTEESLHMTVRALV